MPDPTDPLRPAIGLVVPDAVPRDPDRNPDRGGEFKLVRWPPPSPPGITQAMTPVAVPADPMTSPSAPDRVDILATARHLADAYPRDPQADENLGGWWLYGKLVRRAHVRALARFYVAAAEVDMAAIEALVNKFAGAVDMLSAWAHCDEEVRRRCELDDLTKSHRAARTALTEAIRAALAARVPADRPMPGCASLEEFRPGSGSYVLRAPDRTGIYIGDRATLRALGLALLAAADRP